MTTFDTQIPVATLIAPGERHMLALPAPRFTNMEAIDRLGLTEKTVK